MKIKFKYGECDNCSLQFGRYKDGSYALSIFDDYGEPLINVTKHVPGYKLQENQILVKNYSENEGILECLIEQEIIKNTGIVVPTGFVQLHVCDLLIDPETYHKENK